jgi:DNA-directed RNA polymerase subunit E'/Rpb7
MVSAKTVRRKLNWIMSVYKYNTYFLTYSKRDFLELELKRKFERKNLQHLGYVVGVKVVKIITNECSQSCSPDVVYTLIVEFSCIIPKENDEIDAEIFHVGPTGFMVAIDGTDFKVLVPNDFISNYAYNDASNTFYNAETQDRLAIKSRVRVKLKGIKYINQLYKCYGEFLHTLDIFIT